MGMLDPQDVGNLTPEEQLQKLMAGYTPTLSNPPQNPSEAMSPYDPKSYFTETSDVDAQAQGFGVPRQQAPNQNAGPLLESQADILGEKAAKHNQTAMDMLQQALNAQSEVSPSQALAAGVLALVPTLGGYIGGSMVGSPKLSPHLRLSPQQLMEGASGGAAGGAAGATVGGQAAGQYLGGINAQFDKKQKLQMLMAGEKMKQEDADTAATRQVQVHNTEYDYELEHPKPNTREAPATPTEKAAIIQGLVDLSGQSTSPEERKSIEDKINAAESQSDLYRSAEYERRRISDIKRQGGNIALKPSQTVMDRLGAADNVEIAQERLRSLAKKALDKLGPGFTAAYLRRGIKLLPANDQQQFYSNLEAAGMEMNRAVDPSPNVTGAAAMTQTLLSAVDNGDFFEKLDFESKKAKSAAVSGLRPFTVGPTANEAAKNIYNFYSQKWAKQLESPGGNKTTKLAEIDSKMAALEAQINGMQ